jgi:fido (protein-threonine AMPylation protein)
VQPLRPSFFLIMSDKYNQQDGLVDIHTGLLKNKRGIIDTKLLDQTENQALLETYRYAANHYSDTHKFSVEDICALHRRFLGDLFDWAGTYRTVDLSSNDIRWCHAAHIPAEMQKYNALLHENTPFSPEWTRQELLERLAKVHGELVVGRNRSAEKGTAHHLNCNPTPPIPGDASKTICEVTRYENIFSRTLQ